MRLHYNKLQSRTKDLRYQATPPPINPCLTTSARFICPASYAAAAACTNDLCAAHIASNAAVCLAHDKYMA
jgi:hypothetical protein